MTGWHKVAGVDEAGRGPLAGPVMAAAVILDPALPIDGLADSKKLSARRRASLAECIQRDACAWAIGWADAEEIDRLNILVASHLAMRRALAGLRLQPDHVEVDGNRLPNLQFPGRRLTGTAIIGGDARVAAISAASILAKVARDRTMVMFDRLYPEYGFAQHKGYPTRAHRDSLLRHGPCPQHRRSFRPLSMSA